MRTGVSWLSTVRREAFAVAAALTVVACGPPSVVATSTTTARKGPDYVPPPPDRSTREVSADAPVPKADDPKERVAYLRAGSVFVLPPEGGDPQRVTLRADKAPDTAPAWSPHGDAVAYASARDGVSKIFVAGLDGSGARAVTDGADGGDVEPAWSPDGRSLVFVRGRADERRDLYVIDFDAQAPARKILEGHDDAPRETGAPAWSPDGKTIAFAADRGEGQGTGIFLVAPDGSGLRRLTRPPRPLAWFRDRHPAWSPDGKTVAFASNREATREDLADRTDLFAATVADGSIVRLTHDPARADDPCYSPDGKRIYFTSTRGLSRPYQIELYVMPAGGGEQRRMTRDADPQNAAPSAGRLK